MNDTVNEYVPRPGEFDPLAGEGHGSESTQSVSSGPESGSEIAPSLFRLFTLSDMLNYRPPEGAMLVGDSVIELGEPALLYGPPGSFKGFAIGELMMAGARGHGVWLGHEVKTKFASLWINCENGRRRLRDQFSKMKEVPSDADDYIFTTDYPAIPNLANKTLAKELREIIVKKCIKLLILDTVSSFAEDELAKNFSAFFAALNALLHGLDCKPAVLLVHHSRKPKEGDRGARGLLNLISGHQTLQRRARSICYLGRVTDEFSEKRLAAVWLKCSNSGEAEGTKVALMLGEDMALHEISDFDWNDWQGNSSGGSGREPKVREEHLRELFEHGKRRMTQKNAAEALERIAGVGRSAAYAALQLTGGRFSHLLTRNDDKLIGLRVA